MSRPPAGGPPIEPPACYEIRVDGVLGSRWSTWFEDLQVTSHAGGQTVIAGPVPDDLVTNSTMSSGSMRGTGSRRSWGRSAGTAAGLTAGPVPVTVSRLPGLLTQLTASW